MNFGFILLFFIYCNSLILNFKQTELAPTGGRSASSSNSKLDTDNNKEIHDNNGIIASSDPDPDSDSDPDQEPKKDPAHTRTKGSRVPDARMDKKEDWATILGRKGNKIYAHQLAKDHINGGKPVTIGILNQILAYSNILVTEETLNSLINMPRLTFNNLDKKETIKSIYEKLGLPHSKKQQQGVYIFTCLSTNPLTKYVGSSIQLALRLRGYLNQTHKNSGKFIPLIKEKGLSDFKLEVICLPYYGDLKPEIVLEQYFLLDSSFTLNTIKVSNNPSGSTAKPLYMYNRDRSILYYYAVQQKDFITKLNISHLTFTKHLTNGSYYLGKYLFLRERIDTAKVEEMTLAEIAIMLQNDRVNFNKTKPIASSSKPILLIDIDSNKEIVFESLGKCIKIFLDKGLPVSQKTLVKHLDTNIPYRGYICKTIKKNNINLCFSKQYHTPDPLGLCGKGKGQVRFNNK